MQLSDSRKTLTCAESVSDYRIAGCEDAKPRGNIMKKVFIAAMACVALFSLSGCEGIGKGKGKAPVTVSG